MSEENENTPEDLMHKRWRNRIRMAWVSLISMLVVTILAFFVIPESRLVLLSDVITWFYFGMVSIIGSYMGFTTWASKGG